MQSILIFAGILVIASTSLARAADDLPPIVSAGFDAYSAKGADEAWRAWGLEGAQKGIGQKGELGAEDKAKFLAMPYGKPLGYEVIRKFDVSSSYQTVYVLWRFEPRPLFCMFVCYRGREEWKILNFFVSSDPRELLPESISGMPRNPR